MERFERLSRKELLKVIQIYAKNWLAHDGCWFLAAEEKYGLETAVELDSRSWERFAVAEAKRIMKEFDIAPGGGLKALEEAFQYRLYAAIQPQEIEWLDDTHMVFRMLECRVQKTRQQKNLPAFPCKPVGLIEFSKFAEAVDPRIQTRCTACPPDRVSEFSCGWEFSMAEKDI